MATKCYSIRLQSLDSISPKAYKATDFNGNSDILPKSQVFGLDFDVQKSDAYWVSSWILEQKSLTYSRKKEAMFDYKTGKQLPNYTVVHHSPKIKSVVGNNEIERLRK